MLHKANLILRAALAAAFSTAPAPVKRGRQRTCDATAILFRMLAGFPGDVNRTHPFTVEPALIDPAAPPLLFGGAVIADLTAVNGVRQPAPGDSALTGVYGFLVRPFPVQASSAGAFGTANIGAAVPPSTGACDVLRSGYIMASLPAGSAVPTKGAPVWVWVAANSGAHVQGGVESAAAGGNTIPLTAAGSVCTFNGPPDASGNVEIAFNI